MGQRKRAFAYLVDPVFVFGVLGSFRLTKPAQPMKYEVPSKPQALTVIHHDLGDILANGPVERVVDFCIPATPIDTHFAVVGSSTPTPCCGSVTTSTTNEPMVHAKLQLHIEPCSGKFIYKANVFVRGVQPSRIELEAVATICPTFKLP